MPIGNLLNDFRKWLDGEEAATFKTEEQQPKPRRALEEFLVSIAREIETVMQREMFTPPGGPTYIPREYLVFLSREDDTEWQGDKREGDRYPDPIVLKPFHGPCLRLSQPAAPCGERFKFFGIEALAS